MDQGRALRVTSCGPALDTNILAYAEGLGDLERCTRARELIAALPVDRVVIPTQVMGELYRVMVGKAGQPPADARMAVLGWADSFAAVDSTWEAFRSAMDLVVDHQFQIWDALILSVAAANQCRLLLTEDLQDGFVWHGVTVVNPLVRPGNPLLDRLILTVRG
ncbi:MAG: PIN domain-containing protein [Desulfovibrionales bacterium]|nr:MAG: PIN domain-containing protein [Desulfovibrionales bacterium]